MIVVMDTDLTRLALLSGLSSIVIYTQGANYTIAPLGKRITPVLVQIAVDLDPDLLEQIIEVSGIIQSLVELILNQIVILGV
jgi:hypothetical protein